MESSASSQEWHRAGRLLLLEWDKGLGPCSHSEGRVDKGQRGAYGREMGRRSSDVEECEALPQCGRTSEQLAETGLS